MYPHRRDLTLEACERGGKPDPPRRGTRRKLPRLPAAGLASFRGSHQQSPMCLYSSPRRHTSRVRQLLLKQHGESTATSLPSYWGVTEKSTRRDGSAPQHRQEQRRDRRVIPVPQPNTTRVHEAICSVQCASLGGNCSRFQDGRALHQVLTHTPMCAHPLQF